MPTWPELESYLKAGRIAAKALARAREAARDGISEYDLCEELEGIIWREARPAFPCNLSQGKVAAHYTPPPGGGGGRIDGDNIVKVDLGVHVDGYIADTAISIAWRGDLEMLVEETAEALRMGISAARPGGPISDVGRAVEGYARAVGRKVVVNLAGHRLGQYELHTGLSIPNTSGPAPGKFDFGSAYAIEPFLVPGEAAGRVVDGPPGNIFRLTSRRIPKDAQLAKAASFIWENYRGLPFASRWIERDLGAGGLEALERLKSIGIVYEYPILLEASGAQVAQFEHTIFVEDAGVIVTTATGTDPKKK